MKKGFKSLCWDMGFKSLCWGMYLIFLLAFIVGCNENTKKANPTSPLQSEPPTEEKLLETSLLQSEPPTEEKLLETSPLQSEPLTEEELLEVVSMLPVLNDNEMEEANSSPHNKSLKAIYHSCVNCSRPQQRTWIYIAAMTGEIQKIIRTPEPYPGREWLAVQGRAGLWDVDFQGGDGRWYTPIHTSGWYLQICSTNPNDPHFPRCPLSAYWVSSGW